jgi:hypothetical protein
LPRTRDEDGWVETLIRQDGVIVHPGWFFDMDRDGFVVVSLLPEPAIFDPAIARVIERVSS